MFTAFSFSRIDVYTEQEIQHLRPEAQGLVGILNAKRVWQANQNFWNDKGLELQQETDLWPAQAPRNHLTPLGNMLKHLQGSDIQTNPPETNAAVASSGIEFCRTVDVMPTLDIQQEIDSKVDMQTMHDVLMKQGLEKFVKPQRALLSLIARKRGELSEKLNVQFAQRPEFLQTASATECSVLPSPTSANSPSQCLFIHSVFSSGLWQIISTKGTRQQL